jgi:hypothetical protein
MAIFLDKPDTPFPSAAGFIDGGSVANPGLFRNECGAPGNNIARPWPHRDVAAGKDR